MQPPPTLVAGAHFIDQAQVEPAQVDEVPAALDRPLAEKSTLQRLAPELTLRSPDHLTQSEPWIRDELTDRCFICRQWTAKRGGTKLPLQALHQSEWEQAAELAKAKCLQFQHLVDPHQGCQLCHETAFADRRAAQAHAQNCQVLFQLMMMRRIMHEEHTGPCPGLGTLTVTLRNLRYVRHRKPPPLRSSRGST